MPYQQPQMELQRQVTVENGGHEAIPLNRLTSTQERCRRDNTRNLFDKYDRDGNGYLDVKEMKTMIKNHQCDTLPKGLARHIVEMADDNNDGRIDFEEFYKMSVEHEWLFKGMLSKYCKMIVPSPNRGTAFDETGDSEIRPYGSFAIDEGFSDENILRDGQYESSMSCWPPPLTMVVFSIIEIITFLYDVIQTDDNAKNIDTVGKSTKGPAAQLFIYNPHKRDQVWRFVTYMFVHVGVLHLGMNLIVQIFLGTALELVHCWWRVALVYLAGVLAGSMGTSITDPRIFLAGASGGVYALITAHIATIIINWKEMEYAVLQLFVFLVFCAVDLGSSIYSHINNINDQIGYVAHLSGAIAGLLVGIGVLRNLNVRSWEKKLWWFAILIYTLLMLSGIMVHIFMPSRFPKPQRY